MFTKTTSSRTEGIQETALEFAGSLQRCLAILATEAEQAGFLHTARSLLAQEEIIAQELGLISSASLDERVSSKCH